jgi:subtilisin family serine protease
VISLDVFDADGTGEWSTLITSIDWILANRTRFNITTINMSLGGDSSQGGSDACCAGGACMQAAQQRRW